jgi:hypothetical protein
MAYGLWIRPVNKQTDDNEYPTIRNQSQNKLSAIISYNE